MNQTHEALTRRIRESLKRAEAHADRLKRNNTRLMVSSVVSSGISTLVTGVTAAQGPIVSEGIPGWRISCIVGAVFGFVTTVAVGLNQQLKLSARLSKANEALGRLRTLSVAIDIGSETWEEIRKDYEEIMRTHPEFV